MIKHVTINHYKSIFDATLEFGRINVIVGLNGVGKSNIVDALYFLHDCVEDDLDTAIIKRHGIESLRQWSKTRPFNITIEAGFEDGVESGTYRLTLASTRGSYRVLDEQGHWFGHIHQFSTDKEIRESLGRISFQRDTAGNINVSSDFKIEGASQRSIQLSNTDLFITLLGGPLFSMEAIYLRPLAEQLKSFVSYSIYPNTLREPRVVSRQERLLPDGSNLASIIRQINRGHRSNKERLVDALQTLMPSLNDILVKSAGGYYVPVVSVSESTGDVHQFNMSQLSDGTLRVLGLLAAFYQPNAPTIIALEEPEQMIHPGALPILADASQEFVDGPDGGQIFITTHSPPLLDLFLPESIIWTTFSDGRTSAGRINARQLELIKKRLFTAGEVLITEGFLDQ